MKIYEVRVKLDGYKWLRAFSFEEAVELNGQYQNKWKPLALNWQDSRRPILDFVAISMTGMGVKKELTETFKEEKISGMQFLPIENISTHVVVNPFHIKKAIDYEKADVVRFDDGRVLSFDAYAFRKEAVEQAFLFKIPELGRVYATQNFKDLYDSKGWTGLEFDYLCIAE